MCEFAILACCTLRLKALHNATVPRPSPQTDRVVAVLNLLAGSDGGGSTLTEIARRIGANRASCVHLLAALEGAGYLVRDPADRRYHLGPALITLGSTASRRYPGFDAAREEVDELTRTTGHPCFAFSLERDRARLLYYTWDLRRPAPAMRVGDTITIVPPIGAVFYAWAEPDAIDEWVARAPDGNTEGRRLRDTLTAIRSLGFVVELQPPTSMLNELNRERGPGEPARPRHAGRHSHDFVVTDLVDDEKYAVSSISVPVFDAAGRVAIALNLAGFTSPTTTAEITRLAGVVQAAAARAGSRSEA